MAGQKCPAFLYSLNPKAHSLKFEMKVNQAAYKTHMVVANLIDTEGKLITTEVRPNGTEEKLNTWESLTNDTEMNPNGHET